MLLERNEALLELLLAVGRGIAAALDNASRHDNTVRGTEEEERLTVRMERSLPVATAEVDLSECLRASSFSEFCFNVGHRPQRWLRDRIDSAIANCRPVHGIRTLGYDERRR